jgi:hypothetical protein
MIIILPVVLYGRGTWSRTSREECRLRAFENRAPRRTFVVRREIPAWVGGGRFVMFTLREKLLE